MFLTLFETELITRYRKEPIKDSQSILVYHAFNDVADAVLACTYGLSGKDRPARGRRYSYEANNNPTGLFVAPELNAAKPFGNYVIEFSTRVADLEAPVWPNGSYTTQGEFSGIFRSEEDREAARGKAREQAISSGSSTIAASDRPELASTLLSHGERQALFIGYITPASIRRVWVNPTPETSPEYCTFIPMSVQSFLVKYGNEKIRVTGFDRKERELEWPGKLRKKPYDTVDSILKALSSEYNIPQDQLLSILRGMKDLQLLEYFWPHQLEELKSLLATSP